MTMIKASEKFERQDKDAEGEGNGQKSDLLDINENEEETKDSINSEEEMESPEVGGFQFSVHVPRCQLFAFQSFLCYLYGGM